VKIAHSRSVLSIAALAVAFTFTFAFTANSAAGQAASTTTTQAPAKKPATAGTRTTHMTYDPALLHPATLKAQAPESYTVKFTTTAGDFTVEVTRAWSPNGADRFYNLVKHHFYDGAGFFRVVPGFMVQFGLSAYPQVNAAWDSAKIKDDKVTQSNKPGFITFATAGPNTRTTQVFISYGDNAFLDSQGFSPFGKVTDGMDSVTKINSEYKERPDQGLITTQGKTYLEKNFPKLDTIKTVTITSPAPVAGGSGATPTHHTTPPPKPQS
jgi:peptidyl-prolyl cis-trans isomerase A (cyclophilin A)